MTLGSSPALMADELLVSSNPYIVQGSKALPDVGAILLEHGRLARGNDESHAWWSDNDATRKVVGDW